MKMEQVAQKLRRKEVLAFFAKLPRGGKSGARQGLAAREKMTLRWFSSRDRHQPYESCALGHSAGGPAR
jgi:hypothetical protein